MKCPTCAHPLRFRQTLTSGTVVCTHCGAPLKVQTNRIAMLVGYLSVLVLFDLVLGYSFLALIAASRYLELLLFLVGLVGVGLVIKWKSGTVEHVHPSAR